MTPHGLRHGIAEFQGIIDDDQVAAERRERALNRSGDGSARLDLLEKCCAMLVQDVSMIHFLEVAKPCLENPGKIRTIVAGEQAKFGNCLYDRHRDGSYLSENIFFE
jgi:hypothetical protein